MSFIVPTWQLGKAVYDGRLWAIENSPNHIKPTAIRPATAEQTENISMQKPSIERLGVHVCLLY